MAQWLDSTNTNNPYSDPKVTADYVAKWVQGANSSYGLHIDYGKPLTASDAPSRVDHSTTSCDASLSACAVGIWNERGYTIDYINILRDTLNNYGFEDTSIVAHDAGWDIASDILNNPQLAASVDVIGTHVCRSRRLSCITG